MKAASIAILSLFVLSACTDDYGLIDPNPDPDPAPAPLPATIEIGNDAYPEDVKEFKGSLYTSNFFTGEIVRIQLSDLSRSVFVPAATTDFTAGWGLNIVPSKNWLVSITNKPYDFNPENAVGQMGMVTAYNVETGAVEKTWNLPEGAVGNAIDVDNSGNIYVSDVGPDARIIRIDSNSGDVSVWADGTNFADGGFGLGGMIYNETSGFYYSQNRQLFYVGVNDDGTAAESVEVNTNGAEVDADGMTWAGNNTLFYNVNDVFLPGAQGTTHRIVLSDATTGTDSVVQSELSDSSGAFYTTYNGEPYLFVCESQLGFAFGVDTGDPVNPFVIRVLRP